MTAHKRDVTPLYHIGAQTLDKPFGLCYYPWERDRKRSRERSHGHPALAQRGVLMPATIRDIAKHSGVSISTVSRVLNRRLDTSPEARDAVLAVARELNYTVNLHARA